MKFLRGVFVIVIFSIIASCGSVADLMDAANDNDPNLNEDQQLVDRTALKATSDLGISFLTGFVAFSPVHIQPRAVPPSVWGDSWACVNDPSGDVICTGTDIDGDACTSTYSSNGSDEMTFSLDCTDYDYDHPASGLYIVLNGNFEQTITSASIPNGASFSQETTTPGGFGMSIDDMNVNYGSDFNMTVSTEMTTTTSGADTILTWVQRFITSGTLNSQAYNTDFTMTCVSTNGGYPICTPSLY